MVADSIVCLDDAVEGAVNFRDLGGYLAGDARVRPGQLYRSGMTHTISAAGLHTLATRYGIKSVIDLRAVGELRDDGTGAFAEAGIRHIHAPVFENILYPAEEQQQRLEEMRSGTFDWSASYLRMTEVGGAAFRSVFAAVADAESVPLVFHCAAGRDRTGVTAALLLRALGVDADTVAADYAHTGELLRPHATRFIRSDARDRLTEEQMIRLLATRAEVMHHFLDTLTDRYGSVEGYLASIGVTDDTLRAVRRTLLESVASS